MVLDLGMYSWLGMIIPTGLTVFCLLGFWFCFTSYWKYSPNLSQNAVLIHNLAGNHANLSQHSQYQCYGASADTLLWIPALQAEPNKLYNLQVICSSFCHVLVYLLDFQFWPSMLVHQTTILHWLQTGNRMLKHALLIGSGCTNTCGTDSFPNWRANISGETKWKRQSPVTCFEKETCTTILSFILHSRAVVTDVSLTALSPENKCTKRQLVHFLGERVSCPPYKCNCVRASENSPLQEEKILSLERISCWHITLTFLCNGRAKCGFVFSYFKICSDKVKKKGHFYSEKFLSFRVFCLFLF